MPAPELPGKNGDDPNVVVDNDGRQTTITLAFPAAMAELLKAYEYSVQTRREVWDFAVGIRRLRALGMSVIDLRWLGRMGYVEHAMEVTPLGSASRLFIPIGVSFTKRTCFVLSEAGLCSARSQLDGSSRVLRPVFCPKDGDPQPFACARHDCPRAGSPRSGSGTRSSGDEGASGNECGSVRAAAPSWDAQRRELRVNQVLVKYFKWPAVNQQTILAAFEEERWPPRIDDPLPPKPEQDRKRRLHDAVKCLNRNQSQPLIRFHGDGTGEGVRWSLVESGDPAPDQGFPTQPAQFARTKIGAHERPLASR